MTTRLPPASRLALALEAVTVAQVRAALALHAGSRAAAAVHLGVSRRWLNEALESHPEIAADYPATPGRPRG